MAPSGCPWAIAPPFGLTFPISGWSSRAQASWKGGGKATASPAYRDLRSTAFEGYRQTASKNCEVLAIIDTKTSQGVPALAAGESTRTPEGTEARLRAQARPAGATARPGRLGNSGAVANCQLRRLAPMLKAC